MPSKSRRYLELKNKLEPGKVYTVEEALQKVKELANAKFDETIEVAIKLGIDPKQSDQQIRGTVSLPHGIGKKVRVAVFCKGELLSKAENSGADLVGSEDLIDKVSKGFLDFDVVIAAPDMMRDLSKLGKVLGPRGLMPTPKAGTVTMDIEKAVKEAKAGKVEFKSDKQGGIHIAIGKRSFSKEKLLENAQHLIDAINHAKPMAVKVNLIKSLSVSTTMGPGLRIAL